MESGPQSVDQKIERYPRHMKDDRYDVGFTTDIGRKRSQNQDSLAVHPDLGLFMVADGMGGHRGGETASQMATEVVPRVLLETFKKLDGRDDWNPREIISEAIRTANNEIYQRACTTASLQGMGTTTTALLFKKDTLTIGHVGDSRCYFMRAGSDQSHFRQVMQWQATRDHSLVQEKLRAGLITREEIRTDRMKNVITRSVGFERDVNVETYEMRVIPGDMFLICSDGLSGLITEDEMRALVQQHLIQGGDIAATVQKLVDAANANGGDDNITVIVVKYLGEL